MNRCLHIVFWLFATALSVASCKDDTYDNSIDVPLKLSVDTILVNAEAQTVSIGVTARDGGWTVTGSEPWCTIDPVSGGKGVTRVTVTFSSNETVGDEEPTVTRSTLLAFALDSNEQTRNVFVQQLNTDITPPHLNADYPVNIALHDLLKTWYYNGEAESASADYNQSYDRFWFNFLSKELRRNEDYEGNTWARNGQYYEERYIYSYIEKNPKGTAAVPDPLPPLNYGMEFDLAEYDGRLVGRILYVEPSSPAERAGLKRGDWFYKVNGVQLGGWETNYGDFGWHYNRYIDTLVNPIAGVSPTLGMLSFRAAQHSLVDEERTVTLTPSQHPNNPILGAQVFREERVPEGSGEFVNVGYLMYNNFDPAYRNQLEALFADVFRPGVGGQPLDNFILDLRYNKNGSVEMAELMGNLLVGNVEGVAGSKFADYTFWQGNPDAPAKRSAAFAAHPGGIAVDTVFVLTSRYTAGAAELLINALRGLDQTKVKLVVVGEVTQGLAAGMVKQTLDHLSDEWEYSASMLAFSTGTYTGGFVPNGGAVDEWSRSNIVWSSTWEWKGQPGSREDPLIEAAVDMITGREFIPEGSVIDDTRHQRTGLPRRFCFPTNMIMEIENQTIR